MSAVCSPAEEIRRLLIVFRRKLLALNQQSPDCGKCLELVIDMVAELGARPEEYEYEEAIERWE